MADDQDHRIPGQLIEELLEERGWTKKVLAIVINYDESALNRVIAGKRPVDAEMALLLAEVFGVEPDRFLELQRKYDLAQARIIVKPDPKRASRARLFGGLPVGDMIKRSWIDVDDVRDVSKVETAVLRFFEVNSVDEIETSAAPHAAKKTDVGKMPSMIQCAWLRRVRQIADGMVVPAYNEAALREALPRLRSLMIEPEETRHVPRILQECGVRFVIVQALPGGKIDGVTLWVNSATSPVVALSIRFDRIDNFWYVLRHELEHVLRDEGKHFPMIDSDLEPGRSDGTLPPEEVHADQVALEFCVAKQEMDSWIARKSPFFSERDLIGFAKRIGVHPGLVAGQLRSRTGNFKLFTKYLARVQQLVSPSAVVDGWGQIAPVAG